MNYFSIFGRERCHLFENKFDIISYITHHVQPPIETLRASFDQNRANLPSFLQREILIIFNPRNMKDPPDIVVKWIHGSIVPSPVSGPGKPQALSPLFLYTFFPRSRSRTARCASFFEIHRSKAGTRCHWSVAGRRWQVPARHVVPASLLTFRHG